MFIRYRVNQVKHLEKLNTRMAELENEALRAQMNPHFIFNSLNSIQNFLIDNDLRKSNKYLTKFAKLMRLVLNNSSRTFVSMGDVVSSLEIYLELEQLRFNGKFDFDSIVIFEKPAFSIYPR